MQICVLFRVGDDHKIKWSSKIVHKMLYSRDWVSIMEHSARHAMTQWKGACFLQDLISARITKVLDSDNLEQDISNLIAEHEEATLRVQRTLNILRNAEKSLETAITV